MDKTSAGEAYRIDSMRRMSAIMAAMTNNTEAQLALICSDELWSELDYMEGA